MPPKKLREKDAGNALSSENITMSTPSRWWCEEQKQKKKKKLEIKQKDNNKKIPTKTTTTNLWEKSWQSIVVGRSREEPERGTYVITTTTNLWGKNYKIL